MSPYPKLTAEHLARRAVVYVRLLEPAALEAALEMEAHRHDEAAERRRALELALEQAHYEADRARRQYDAVEPENRLVAGELERRWNEALARVEQLRAQLDELSAWVSPKEPERIDDWLGLADELTAAWHDPTCDVRLKKRIVRTLVEEILVDVGMEAATVHRVIHWAGGAHTELMVRKHRTGQHR